MIIKNGYIIDPANNKEGNFDILIKGNRIEKVAKDIKAKDKDIIDAKGKIVVPGLIDMHVHLREPGKENMETVKSGTRAALKGGITSILSMPNTYPAMDSPKNIKEFKKTIAKDALTNVFITGAITKERKGINLTDMKALKREGAAALSDDGDSIQNTSLMLKAMKKAKDEKILLIDHCENKEISKNGVINEGIMATKLGLRALPKKAEYEFVKRDIELAKKIKSRVHIAHVSCMESVDLIRKAKKQGINITAEVTPHHFSLKDECCANYDTRTKMNPPLRSEEDVEAIKKGLQDGTIDAIASDHAPHGKHEKEAVFEEAAFGIIGLETSLALAIKELIDTKIITWKKLIELMSVNPAKILGLKKIGSLSTGNNADITIIDPKKTWVYKKETIASKSKNSPFINWRFKGKATDVIINGKAVKI